MRQAVWPEICVSLPARRDRHNKGINKRLLGPWTWRCHPSCFSLSWPGSVRSLSWTGHREMVQRHPSSWHCTTTWASKVSGPCLLSCFHRLRLPPQQYMVFGKRQTRLHGALNLSSLTVFYTSPTTQHAWHLIRCTWDCWSAWLCWYTLLVNEAKLHLYTVGLKRLESVTPTQHALNQHTRWAGLIAAIQRQKLNKAPEIQNPCEWGWEWNPRTKKWVLYWTDLPEACLPLVRCCFEMA